MRGRRETQKYYFSVEGETEKRYFQWLAQKINSTPETRYSVKFDCAVSNPLKRAKSLAVLKSTGVIHVFDYECNNSVYEKRFLDTLDAMRKAETSGKKIHYLLGYSNFTFELWIILHKKDCFAPMNDRKQYLVHLKDAYKLDFESLEQYKKEAGFQKILDALTLEDVKAAVERAECIMKKRKEECCCQRHKRYKYYRENPSLSIGDIIGGILKDCQLL